MCGTDEYAYRIYLEHPHLQSLMEQNRAYLEKFTQEYIASSSLRGANDSLYVIPVVFHVIHMYGTENVSDEQIMSGLYVLNRNFALQHPDTGNIVTAFKPIAANCDIVFKLAHKDPDGNCTSGINRIASPLTKTGDHSVKSLIHWDPSRYLNVYVVRSIPNLAGHCLMPDQADAKPEWDGIVIDDNYLGNIGTSSELTSVVMAHEAGHYLNLFHIWGGNNVPGYYYQPVGQPVNCTIGDQVQDTPETIGWSNCNLNNASCGNPVDNIQNVMDYSYCNFMFTKGQRQRMRAALNSPVANRNNLITPANLAATGVELTQVCKADFVSDRTVVCAFDSVRFHDKSIGPATSWQWNFGDGTTSSQQNPVHVYDAPGEYNVTLTAGNAYGSLTSATQKIRVYGDDVNPFFVETFEMVNDFAQTPLSIRSDNPNLQYTLSQPGEGFQSNRAAVLRLPDTSATFTGRVTLFSPAINLTAAGMPTFSFRYACSQKKLNIDDALEVFISTDCGKTWLSKGKRTGANLRTVNTPQTNLQWVPADSTEWKMYSFQLNAQQAVNRFMFRIEYTNYYGNALLLDNIFLNEEAYTDVKDTYYDTSTDVIPNPTDGFVTLYGVYADASYRLINHTGALADEGVVRDETSLNWSHLPSGIYFLHLTKMRGTEVHKIIKY